MASEETILLIGGPRGGELITASRGEPWVRVHKPLSLEEMLRLPGADIAGTGAVDDVSDLYTRRRYHTGTRLVEVMVIDGMTDEEAMEKALA